MDRCRRRNIRLRFINRIPFFFRACEINIGQSIATIERLITNTRDTVGNRNARQATATYERRIANTRDAVGNFDARQATAIFERLICNRFRSVLDCISIRNGVVCIYIINKKIRQIKNR